MCADKVVPIAGEQITYIKSLSPKSGRIIRRNKKETKLRNQIEVNYVPSYQEIQFYGAEFYMRKF